MPLSHRSRLITVIFSLCALLLTQSALASYVCPGKANAAAAEMVVAGMPCAEVMSRAMDETQPGLCHAHCQAEQQSADSYQFPALASLDDLGAVLTLALIPRPKDPHELQVPLMRRDAGPPLAVRHCCLRI